MVKLLRCSGALPRVRQRRGPDGRPLHPELLSPLSRHHPCRSLSSLFQGSPILPIFCPSRPSRPWCGTT